MPGEDAGSTGDFWKVGTAQRLLFRLFPRDPETATWKVVCQTVLLVSPLHLSQNAQSVLLFDSYIAFLFAPSFSRSLCDSQ